MDLPHFLQKMYSSTIWYTKCFTPKFGVPDCTYIFGGGLQPKRFTTEKVYNRKGLQPKRFTTEKVYNRKGLQPKRFTTEKVYNRKGLQPKRFTTPSFLMKKKCTHLFMLDTILIKIVL